MKHSLSKFSRTSTGLFILPDDKVTMVVMAIAALVIVYLTFTAFLKLVMFALGALVFLVGLSLSLPSGTVASLLSPEVQAASSKVGLLAVLMLLCIIALWRK